MSDHTPTDISKWLATMLKEPWSSASIIQYLHNDALNKIKVAFPAIETSIKLRVLLSFLCLTQAERKAYQDEIKQILELSRQDGDEWVRVIGGMVGGVEEGYVGSDGVLDNAVFLELLNDVKGKLAEDDVMFVPKVYGMLSHGLFEDGEVEKWNTHEHFSPNKPIERVKFDTKKDIGGPPRRTMSPGLVQRSRKSSKSPSLFTKRRRPTSEIFTKNKKPKIENRLRGRKEGITLINPEKEKEKEEKRKAEEKLATARSTTPTLSPPVPIMPSAAVAPVPEYKVPHADYFTYTSTPVNSTLGASNASRLQNALSLTPATTSPYLSSYTPPEINATKEDESDSEEDNMSTDSSEGSD